MRASRPKRSRPSGQSFGRGARVALTMLVLCALTACDAGKAPSGGSPRTLHEDGHGPLSAQTLTGGKALLAPAGANEWWASFGTPLLCNTSPNKPIRISAVRYDAVVKPIAISTKLRVVPSHAAESAEDPVAWNPFGGLVGRPGQFMNATIRGDFVDPRGQKIVEACNARSRAFTELVTSIKVSDAGAWIRRSYIDYSVDRRRYTLVVRWQMVGCGKRTTRQCSPSG